jgi:hypothetical protein
MALSLSACGAPGNTSGAPAPAEAAAVATSAAASPSPSPSPTFTQLVPGYTGIPAPAGGPVTIGDVKYTQSTIADDDPAMSPKREAFDASTAVFSSEDLQAAVAAVIKFTAQEGIDSTLNGGLETLDQWWSRTEGNFHPDYKQVLYDSFASGEKVVMREEWQKQYEGRYKYLTPADQTRIYNRNIEVNTVWILQEPGTLAVAMDVTYAMLTTPGVGRTGTGIQRSEGEMIYSVTKDVSGRWLIDGYDHDMKTTEG